MVSMYPLCKVGEPVWEAHPRHWSCFSQSPVLGGRTPIPDTGHDSVNPCARWENPYGTPIPEMIQSIPSVRWENAHPRHMSCFSQSPVLGGRTPIPDTSHVSVNHLIPCARWENPYGTPMPVTSHVSVNPHPDTGHDSVNPLC